jgi:hypothetical protein
VSVQTREHTVDWVTAAPLFSAFVGTDEPDEDAKTAMRRPALLRFHSDRFMDDLQATVADQPVQLADNLAKIVSFRNPPPGAPANWVPDGAELKLFQPIHGDFNLVAATLACPRPGLPEHPVNTATHERASFVLRRVDTSGELAWLAGARQWAAASDPPDDDEERLPLFAIPYTDKADEDRRRTFFVGLIPTSSRDTFQNAGVAAMTPTDRTTTPEDPRQYELRVRVADPLDGLVERSSSAETKTASALLFVDFADFLQTFATATWNLIQAQPQSPASAHPGTLYATLATKTVSGITWAQALHDAWAQRMSICNESTVAATLSVDLAGSTAFTGAALITAVMAALPTNPPAPTPPATDDGDTTFAGGDATAAIPKLTGDATYVIRCVYERPDCPDPTVVSNPTAEFHIGGFFDLDAPARRVHIAMPVDTSIADLRKFKKTVSIALSDQLKQQMSRISELKDMTSGTLAAGEPLDVGMLCSFSIPIITICALMVLMIFLSLLNIIFFWLPFFRICFPISLKSK